VGFYDHHYQEETDETQDEEEC